ncbi:hypothetical protein NIES970_29250 (plasmid) [[Synechococcus] sp. NIES-970]|nr:hypothetical protein NIES970_29250 [[Synechococcus] sp. NIES-970]
MSSADKKILSALYTAQEIREAWEFAQNRLVIQHPKLGAISPNEYRLKFSQKPCPFCAKKMTHGKTLHATQSRQEAISRGYQYINNKGKDYINQAGEFYFHPHYVTLDHKINKARCPELMFDHQNLQAICWRCNIEKGDNNAYEIEQALKYIQDLKQEISNRYKFF